MKKALYLIIYLTVIVIGFIVWVLVFFACKRGDENEKNKRAKIRDSKRSKKKRR